MYKVPETEITRVNDLIGLVSRKVKDRSITPVIKYSTSPTKAPPVAAAPFETSYVVRALGVYNGWIPLNDWLNRPDTMWSQCSVVAHVLSGRKDHALAYLTACGLKADMQTAGYLRGQLAAMEDICLLRQIYGRIQSGVYTQPTDCTKDVVRFVRFGYLSSNISKVATDMFNIGLQSGSLDEFETRWMSTIMPVSNFIHARRILKKRARKTVLDECLSMLHQRLWEVDYGMYYFLGVMSRFHGFNLYDPYWTEDTLRPLRNLFFLYGQVDSIDFNFVRQGFPELIPVLRIHQPIHLELIYFRYIAWLLYTSALQDKSLSSVVDKLSFWEKELNILIRSNPQAFARLYSEVANFDMTYAEIEVSQVVVIVDLRKQT